eukprot:XP_001705206.1 Hypothetical protein GL50803_19323 [Giardia lamblia ATCC 50803]
MGTNRVLVELLGLCVHKRKHKTSEVVPVLEGGGNRSRNSRCRTFDNRICVFLYGWSVYSFHARLYAVVFIRVIGVSTTGHTCIHHSVVCVDLVFANILHHVIHS